jgi:hypothetical protein
MSSLIPEDISFNQNAILYNSENKDIFYQIGEYKVSSSSILNNKNDTFYAFDNNQNTFWTCNNSLNKDAELKYKQDSYNGFVPSSYIGGGTNETYWKTISNNKQYLGEWIQIKLPYSAYLAEYSIMSKQFPRQFYLLGSNDGSTWELIDSQSLNQDYSNSSSPIKFKVNTILQFNHYRLVISQLFNGTSASINEFKLFGNRNMLVNLKSLENYDNYSNYTGSYNSKINSQYNSNTTNYSSMAYKPFSKFDEITINKINENFSTLREPYTIQELGNKLNEYNSVNGNAITNHGNLVTGINNYLTNSNNLLNSSLYDYSGNILFLNNGKPTIKDALESDTKELASQENNVFILGTMSLAILIIGTIMVLRN